MDLRLVGDIGNCTQVVIEDNNEDEQIHLHSKETRDNQGCGIRYITLLLIT